MCVEGADGQQECRPSIQLQQARAGADGRLETEVRLDYNNPW